MGKTVETKRKKKGRPSLLDLQKRSLRLQQQQQLGNPNPSPNPYVRFPSTGAGQRRTRRNPIIEPEAGVNEEEGEEEEENVGKRREKKLKHVLRIQDQSANSPPHLGPSGSESEGEGSGLRRKRKIEAVGSDGRRLKVDGNSSLKATESLRAETSNPGPTTPLPDKKLLLFILDLLQKKDTYGVFSEPVDSEELPDYLEVIEQPMDFSTVRKKLSRGAYKNLEQFEKDVFLISSNAMSYNAPYTIYYRQARSIREHAKKNFENLRQESDKEPETKTVVRRGRPPSKNINQPIGFLHTDFASTGFSSDPILANARGGANLSSQGPPLWRKGSVTDRPGSIDVSAKVPYGLRSSDSFGLICLNKVDGCEKFSGFSKDVTTRFGKRAPIMEEDRRNTYSQFQPYNYGCEMPILSLFDSEKKQLTAVGLHVEYAYALSLARFAAHLGSIGWSIAAQKIEKLLPPGMKFGRGWVGENEELQQSQSQIQSPSPPNQSSQAMPSPCTQILESKKSPSQKLEPSCSNMASPACDVRSSDSSEKSEDRFKPPVIGAGNESRPVIQPKPSFQSHSARGMQSTANGFTSGFRFNPPSQTDSFSKPLKPPSFCSSQPSSIHAQDHNLAQRNNPIAAALIPPHSSHVDSHMAGTSSNDSQWRGSSMQAKPEPVPPDLNVRFQPPGSPSSRAVVDAPPPDLALQL